MANACERIEPRRAQDHKLVLRLARSPHTEFIAWWVPSLFSSSPVLDQTGSKVIVSEEKNGNDSNGSGLRATTLKCVPSPDSRVPRRMLGDCSCSADSAGNHSRLVRNRPPLMDGKEPGLNLRSRGWLCLCLEQAKLKRPLNADASLASAPDLGRIDTRQTVPR